MLYSVYISTATTFLFFNSRLFVTLFLLFLFVYHADGIVCDFSFSCEQNAEPVSIKESRSWFNVF